MIAINKEMNIKDLLENEEYRIILDTNVLLNVYRFAPGYTEYAYGCLDVVKDYIILPATVRYEYGKHCRSMFAKMENRTKLVSAETKNQIAIARKKITESCDNYERLHFPDCDKLRSDLEEALNNAQKSVEDFFVDRQAVELAGHAWNGEDRLKALVAYIESAGNILDDLTYDDVYKWSEEGDKRFKDKTPPGFEDDVTKSQRGIAKYGDLFIWKEIIRFAELKKQNVIFVTDDSKDDWWENISGKRTFHHVLIEEFQKTGQKIIALDSPRLYEELSACFIVQRPESTIVALDMTDNDYCEAVKNRVFERVENTLIYRALDYLDLEKPNHIGSEGIDEFEIVDYSLESFEREDVDDSYGPLSFYIFKYSITLEGTSYEYWGRDDDTKEVIRSLGTEHVLKGWIEVGVDRKTGLFVDYLEDDSFESAEIIGGKLVEDSYHNLMDDCYNGDAEQPK